MHKLTSKRQVTIPKAICGQLGLEPGDSVEVFARDGVAHLVRMSDESLAGKFAELTNHQKIPAPTAIRQAIKSRAAKKYKASDDSD
jgi:AbrB family looped-hinge helix DNA binding protein